MRVVFRVDASIQIGTGHVMRCLTLADELTRQGHECWFICREHPAHLGEVIISKGYSLSLLPATTATPQQQKNSVSDDYACWLGVPLQEDANQTLDAISTLNPDWLVVDHYALDAQWERTLSSAVGKIMVIDDLANRPHECSLVLDQNLGRVVADYDGLLPSDCQRLIGPRYALLRPEFSTLREQSLARRKNPELKRILISLGGVDRTNVTGRILSAIDDSLLPDNTELDIIMGPSAPYLKEVRQQAEQLPFKATVSVNVQDMAERMCLADLSIGAAGGSSWERCCLGLPTVLLAIAKNESMVSHALTDQGAVIPLNIDCLEVNAKSALATSLETAIGNLGRIIDRALVITDGRGSSRVTTNLERLG